MNWLKSLWPWKRRICAIDTLEFVRAVSESGLRIESSGPYWFALERGQEIPTGPGADERGVGMTPNEALVDWWEKREATP